MANNTKSLITSVDVQRGGIFNASMAVFNIESLDSGGQPVADSQSAVAAGMCVQNFQAQIQKQLRQFWELGSNNYYVADGRPSGSGSIQHILGPNTEDVLGKIKNWAQLCNNTRITLGADKSQDVCPVKTDADTQQKKNGVGGKISLSGGYLNAVGVSAAVPDYHAMSNLQFIFYDLVDANQA